MRIVGSANESHVAFKADATNILTINIERLPNLINI